MLKHPVAKFVLVFVLLGVIGSCVYFSSLKNGFVYDDEDIIVNNVFIKHVKYWPRLFKSDIFPYVIEAPRYYRPLPALTHALEYHLWKLDQRWYHLNNIILHCCNAFLVFLLISMLFNNFGLALLTSIFFVIHPIQTSCVNWIVCRDNLLLSFFGLLSIIFYLSFLRLGKTYRYLLSLVFFALSLLCKDTAFFFIPLLLICAIRYNQNIAAAIRKIWPFLLIFSIYLLVRVFVIKTSFKINSYNYLELGFGLSFLNFFNIILRYLGLLIFPLHLHVSRMTPFLTSFFGFQPFFVISGALSLFALFIWSVINKKEILWFGIAWFLILTVFVFKAMYLKVFYGALMSELWLYLPSVGFFLIIAYLLIKLFNSYKTAFIVVTLNLCLLYMTLSIYNSGFWKNNSVLFENTLRLSGLANDVRINLAYYYMNSGDYKSAEREFRKSLEQWPSDPAVYAGLGDFYYNKGQAGMALKMYTRAHQLKANPIILNNIGAIYGRSGDNENALHYFLAALKLNGNLHLTYGNLGSYYLGKGRYNEAISYFSRAADLNPSRSDYFIKLGNAYAALNLFADARQSFIQALEIDPVSQEALIGLRGIGKK